MPPASPPAFRRIPLHIGLSAAELETVGLHGSKSEGGWSFFREGDALYVARSFARTDCWMLRLHLDATGVVAVDVEGCVGKHATAVAALAWHVVHRHLLSGSVEYESDDALIEALEARVGRHALEAVPRSRATWIAYYEEETRRHPNCSGPWIEYAGLLSLGKDPSAARRAFGRAIELENSPTYLLKRAEFHLNCRDYDAMMPDLMATVDRFPESGWRDVASFIGDLRPAWRQPATLIGRDSPRRRVMIETYCRLAVDPEARLSKEAEDLPECLAFAALHACSSPAESARYADACLSLDAFNGLGLLMKAAFLLEESRDEEAGRLLGKYFGGLDDLAAPLLLKWARRNLPRRE